MNTKQEHFDPHEMIIKTEPDIVSSQTEVDSPFTIQQTFKNEHSDLFSIEIIKHELCESFEFPTKIEPVLVSICPTLLKKELDATSDVKMIDTNVIKQEVSEYVQPKSESELLTSHCDLPTLKIENTDYGDYMIQSRSHKLIKRTDSILKPLKNNVNIVSKKKRRRFPCHVCQKNFPSSKSRSAHFDGHIGKRFVVCKFCGKLLTKNEYFRHYFIHVVKNRTRKVSRKNIEVSSLKPHLKIHDNENPFKCDICSKGYKGKLRFQQHLIIHTNENPFKCDICSKGFKGKWRLEQHLIIHSNEKPFKCEFCPKEFKRKASLQTHLVIHSTEKPFKCDICFKEFTRKWTLQQHLIIHSNEKPFKCDICSKEFTQKPNLQQHLILHTNEKPFKCDICSKEFTQKFNLQQHLLIHTKKKPFKCEICSKEFRTKWTFKQHLVIHSNKKPFKCYKCLEEFKSKYYLKTHLLIIHSTQKPFKCEICSKKFTLKSTLNQHLATHTNEKLFKCDNF